MPELPTPSQTAEEILDLQQYITNLLYYAHIEAQAMTMKEFDDWVEREINNIGEYASIKQMNDNKWIKEQGEF